MATALDKPALDKMLSVIQGSHSPLLLRTLSLPGKQLLQLGTLHVYVVLEEGIYGNRIHILNFSSQELAFTAPDFQRICNRHINTRLTLSNQ